MIRSIVMWCFCLSALGSNYYVSKTGSPANSGSLAAPWTILAALTTNTINPGDTIWIRAGTYQPPTDFPLAGLTPIYAGATNNPITIRAYPNEHPIIAGYFGIYKRWITIQDLEFTDLSVNWGRPTSTGRFAGDGTDPFEPALGVDYPRSSCWLEADYCKVINCFIHDCPIGTFSGGGNLWYGNVFIGNGCMFTNFSTIGEGMYLHNGDAGADGDGSTLYDTNAPAVLQNNVFIYGPRSGVDEWGSQLGIVKNVHSTNNIVMQYDFNCRAQVTTVQDNDIVGNVVAGNPPNFFTYVVHLTEGYGDGVCSNLYSGDNLVIGGSLGYRNLINSRVSNNIICTPGTGGFACVQWDVSDTNTTTMGSNSYFSPSSIFTNLWYIDGSANSFPSWTNKTGMDATSTYTKTQVGPSTNIVKIFTNSYAPGRMNIFIANFQTNATVSLDLSGKGLSIGNHYTIRYLPNWNGATLSGTYDGNPVTVQMTNWPMAQPKFVQTARAAGITSANLVDFPDAMPFWGSWVLLPDSDTNPFIRVVP